MGREQNDSGPARISRAHLKASRRDARERRRRQRRWLRTAVRWGAGGLVAAAGLGWLGYSIVTARRLPPTSMADHVEESPPRHILATPMPIAIQKHMLEHADGSGPPGVVINYNCETFRCPEGTVKRLAEIARGYPTFVYLAPYPDMDVKITVTRLGKILVLDDVDAPRIHAFIRG